MIYVVCGMRGSGKDTLVNAILEKYPDRFVREVGYTTRPIRPGEVDGKTYHFVTESPENTENIFAYREYNTCNGTWHYWHKKIETKKDILAISVLDAVEEYIAIYGKDNVKVLWLNVEPETAFKRMYERERRKSNPDYQEVCRRFISDCETVAARAKDTKIYGIDMNSDIDDALDGIGEILEGVV